jgi:nucleotide-binding universal stress UspA family protein
MWQGQKIEKIFVVLDGSPEAEGALELVRNVVGAAGEELVLVSVVPSFTVVPSHDVVAFTDFAGAAGEASRYLEELASRISEELPGLQVRTLVKVSPLSTADVGAELMHLAAEEGCSLVIVTAGSTAARGIMPEHNLAVLLVPPADQPGTPGRPVPLPRTGLLSRPGLLPRARLALGSLFFFGGPEGSVLLGHDRAGP